LPVLANRKIWVEKASELASVSVGYFAVRLVPRICRPPGQNAKSETMSAKTELLKAADALIGGPLCRLLGRITFHLERQPPHHQRMPSNPKRILVVRPGGIGDMVLLLPALRKLQEHFPTAKLEVICERRNLEVLRLSGWTGDVFLYDWQPFRLCSALLRRRYDIAIDTEQFHHFSAVFTILSRAPIRIGFKINPRRNPLYTHLVNYALDGLEAEQFAALLAPLGINQSAHWALAGFLKDLSLPINPRLAAELASPLEKERLAVLHAGASCRYKKWSCDNFTALIKQLHAEFGLTIALVGSHADRPESKLITRSLSPANQAFVRNYTGQLTLAQSAALIKRARLFVGSDSGLAHLAVALDVPTVVLFGPSDAQKWGMVNKRHAVVRKTLPCAPCFIFGYHRPCRTLECMRSIQVDDVLTACRRLL